MALEKFTAVELANGDKIFINKDGKYQEGTDKKLIKAYELELDEKAEAEEQAAAEERKKRTQSLPLRMNKGIKEAILLYGASGSGKTKAWLDMANKIYKSGSPAHFFAIDTDYAVALNGEHYPELMDSGRLHFEECLGFAEIAAATEKFKKLIDPRRDDWFVIDKIGDAWAKIPEYYVETRLKTTLDELEKGYRGSSKRGEEYRSGNALLEYYAGGISPLYQSWEDKVIYGSKCNVLFTAGEKDIVSDTGRMDDSEEAKLMFGKFKPDCNKNTPFKFHTILRTSHPYQDKWALTTIRERRVRTWMKREFFGSFGDKYLDEIAKWERREF